MFKKQIILPLELESREQTHRDNEAAHNFIISMCNVEAYNAINNHSLWPDNRLLILGEEGSGKSYLANAWSNKTNAVIFQANMEFDYDNKNFQAIVLEDIDDIDESELFHLINYSFETHKYLLMTARTLPNFKLKDLKSRVNATYKVLIKNPDDELVMILLQKYFIQNQIKVESEVLDYLSMIINRSFAAINRFLKSLDAAALTNKRAITIPFIKSVFPESEL